MFSSARLAGGTLICGLTVSEFRAGSSGDVGSRGDGAVGVDGVALGWLAAWGASSTASTDSPAKR
ncbi:MAG TPA: hypothetical protein VGX76_09200, partial [Pirellulales bacterium]|nr:hypothetical protein [Pirellulales bacterium]